MKRILALLGRGFGILFAVLLVLLLSPFIAGIFICSTVASCLNWFWRRIRHDPVAQLVIDGLDSESWPDADTKDRFVDAFTRVSARLAELA